MEFIIHILENKEKCHKYSKQFSNNELNNCVQLFVHSYLILCRNKSATFTRKLLYP